MKKIEWLIPLTVLVAGLAAYSNCLHNGFVFDDVGYIVDNPDIRSLWPPGPIWMHSTRPAVNFTLAVNYALGRLNPWGYHAVNLGIHLLAALTLYGVVRRSVESPRLRWKGASSAPWLAGFVAALWVVHPLQTESVTYTWQRCESLMGLFYLLTLYCVIRGVDSSRARWWYACAVISCALGMGSKEVMATAPLVALLYDRAFLAESWTEVVRRRWGLYVGLALTWVVFAILLIRGTSQTGVYLPTANVAYQGIGRWPYLLTQAGAILHYLKLSFWPHPLCLDYGSGWPVAKTVTDVLPSLIVVFGLLSLTIWIWGRQPALGFLGAWFFLILAPTSSFVPIDDVMFEHRMYLPLAAVIVAMAVAVAMLLRTPPLRRRWLTWGISAAAVAWIVVFAAMTVRRNEDYRSTRTIWQDTIAKMPSNPRAQFNWGTTLVEQNRLEESIGFFKEALRLKPNYPDAQYNWGHTLADLGRLDEAVPHYQEAVRLKPDHAAAHLNLGTVLGDLGHYDEALTHFQAALQITPRNAEAHNNWGNVLANQGHADAAILHYQEALRLKSDYSDAHNNWGNTLRSLGRMDEAIAHYREAARIDPKFAATHNNWGTALASQGRFEEAFAQFQAALEINPNLERTHDNWGLALANMGRIDEATTHFQKALQINPNYLEGYINYGNFFRSVGRLEEAAKQYRRATEIHPNSAEAHNNLGSTLAAQGHFEEAIRHYQAALRINPNLALTESNLGQALAALGRTPEAITHYQLALQLKPTLAEAHDYWGRTLVLQQRFPEAAEHFQLALQLNPGLASARDNLRKTEALLHQKAGPAAP